MGYSTSTKTLDKLRQYLTNLEEGRGDRWVLAEGASPQKFAARIREALKIAEENPRYIPALADAKKKFRVEIVDKRTVQAIYRSPQIDVVESGVVNTGLARGEKNPPDVVAPALAAQIIQVWHNVQPSNERLHFPQSTLNFEEKLKLFKWCKMDRPIAWYMIVGMNDEITLCPYFNGVESVEWTPEDG